MTKPLVSIVIPVFNKEEWIIQTLMSVYSQTYPNWECLIVDDGSTDASLLAISEFTKKHPGNWKIISQVNSGQSPARNLGIDSSAGVFIAFLDADDLWLPNKLELQVKFLLSNPDVGLVLTPYIIFREGQKSNFRLVGSTDSRKMIDNWLSMTGFGGLIESTGLVRKETIERFERFSSTLSMTAGLDLALRMASEIRVKILRDPLVFYRLSIGQFHKQEAVLIRDLKAMTVKFAKNDSDLDRLQRLHASYLYWSNCRIRGTRYFVLTSLKNIFFFRWRHIPMLYCLVSRNTIALLRGFFQRKLTRDFLDKFSL